MSLPKIKPHPSSEILPAGNEPLYSESGVDLTLIRWMLSLTPAERLQVLQQTIHSILRLSLINDILDLSKVEAGKMELTRKAVGLRTTLENSLSMIKEKALKHGIQVSTRLNGIPDFIQADERKLKQIIYNLLSNAAKFTPDGGKVCLSADLVGRPPFPGGSFLHFVPQEIMNRRMEGSGNMCKFLYRIPASA